MSDPIKFKARLKSGDNMHVLYKDDGSMLIWGPASVDIVDKENDRVTTEALKDALPQLMRRSRLSLEHSDQLVGDIKESHKFDEPKTMKVDGNEIERDEFPTAVLKEEEDGVPHDGLYVAGEVWSDTKQAAEVQEKIEDGRIDSYSISGEAIESSTRVKDNNLIDDIKSMDLSAVTLCEEGMNQKAKFAVVKSEDAREKVITAARDALSKSMGKEDEGDEGGVGDEESMDNVSEGMSEKEVEKLHDTFASVLKEELPDGELATKDDIPDDDSLREKFTEWNSGDEEQAEKDEDVDPDEIEDPDDDGEEEMEVDSGEDEDEKSMPGLNEKAHEHAVNLAAHTEKTVDEILESFEQKGDKPTFVEDDEEEDEMPEDDEEEKMPGDDEEDEELEDEDIPNDDEPDDEPEMDDESGDVVEAGHNVDIETLKGELPDDLFEAVADHLSDPDEGEVEMADDGDSQEEKEIDSDPAEGDESDVEKSAGNYVESIGPDFEVADDEQFAKSFEHEDVGEMEGDSSDALDAFYDEVEN